MKLVSKKNGTTTIFPNFISALASKIGFTPPSGMSSTNVQDAIEEVDTRISTITSLDRVDITAYVQTNKYTVPCDGYVLVSCDQATNSYNQCYIETSNDLLPVQLSAPTQGIDIGITRIPVFVRKGMKVHTHGIAGTNSKTEFYPLSY